MAKKTIWEIMEEAHQEVERMTPRERGEHPCPGCGDTLRTCYTRCKKCHCQTCDGAGHVIDDNSLEMYQCHRCDGRGYIQPNSGT